MELRAALFTVILLCFGVLLNLKGSCALQTDNESRDYISWDDMKVVGDTRTLRKMRKLIVVDKNGRGDSVTVQGAVDMVPENNRERVKILILPGIYREKVRVPESKPYISFIGKENRTSHTVITWHDKASDRDKKGRTLHTGGSATVSVESKFFCATAITIENSVMAKPGVVGDQAVALGVLGDQAVALRVVGKKAMFYKIKVLGSQDTLMDDDGIHYFYQCYIQGTVDFIFGNAKSLYQDCKIYSIATKYGSIAAQHREEESEDTGYSFVNCKIYGTGHGNVLLGRAWGKYSRTVYSNSVLSDIITPVGWDDWKDHDKDRNVMFGEYNCTGKGAERRGRVPWSKSLTPDEAKPFLTRDFIYGDQWLRL